VVPKAVTGERLTRAKALFESALEVPRDQRAAHLAESCGDDLELRNFVETLLKSHESGDSSFLEPPPRSDPHVGASQTVEVRQLLPGPRVGTRIGQCEITDVLGEGGMGKVWKGWDSLLERPVAIKFLAENLGSSAHARERFLREARAASTLSHPGIATVFNVGEHAGRAFIMFRLIDGETVYERVKRGPLPVADALRLASEAAEALGHAHERGVLHRDMTSRNVMIDRDERAVIVDFGLALPEMDPRITKTGSTLGTVGYMAPEILQGRSADRRSDIYGLGVVLYEMLTTRLPFEGERQESVLYAIVNEPAEAPSRRRPEIPRDVDRVLLKLLAKNPTRRYQTTAELVEDLRRLEAGLTPAADVTPAESTTQLWRTEQGPRTDDAGWKTVFKRRWVLIPVAAVIAVVGWRLFFPPPPAPTEKISLAVLPLQNDSENAGATDHLTEGIGEALATKLAHVSSFRVTPWITSHGYRPMEPLPLAAIGTELGAQHLLVGTFRQLGSRLQIRLSLTEAASGMQVWAEEFLGLESDLLDFPGRIAASVAGQLHVELSPEESAALAHRPTESVDAYEAYLRGKTSLRENSPESATRALSFFERAASLDPNLAEAHEGIGAVYFDRYFYGWEGGYRSLEAAETNYRTAVVLDPRLWSAHRGLVRVAWEAGHSEESLRIGALAADSAPDDIGALFTRAEAFLLGGLPALAIPLFDRILALDPANRGAQWFLVLANAWSGRFDATIAAAEEYLRRFEEDAEVYTWLGVAHHARDERDVARLAYTRAVELFGEETDQYVYIFAGVLAREMDQTEVADTLWARAIADLEPRLTANPDNFRIAAVLATIYGLSGDVERAAGIRTRPADGSVPFMEMLVAVADAQGGHPGAAVNRLREMVDAGSLTGARGGLTWLGRFLPGVASAPGYEELQQAYRAYEDRLRGRYGSTDGENRSSS